MARIVNRRFKRLTDVYAAVPALACQGLCADQCTSLAGSRAERLRARQAGVDVLDPTRRIGSTCPALVDERCTIFAARPLLCRLYGAVDAMPCPHGCQPDRMLTGREGQWLLAEARRLGGVIR